MADNYVALRLKATDDAKPDLEDLKVRLDELKGKVAEARAKVDTVEADLPLARLEAKLEAVSKQIARPRIDMAGGARAVAELEAVDVAMRKTGDEAGIMAAKTRLAGANAAKGIGLFTLAASGLAMSGPFAAAGLAAVAFGAVAIPVLHKVAAAHTALAAAQQKYAQATTNAQRTTALKAEAAATAGLTDQQKGLMGQVAGLQKTWNGLEAAMTPVIVQVTSVALKLAGALLPAMDKLVPAGAKLLDAVIKPLTALVSSPFFAQFTDQMAQMAAQMGSLLGPQLVNLIELFMQLFMQAGPAGIRILSILLPLIIQLATDLVPVITVIAEVVAATLKWLQNTHLLIPVLALVAVAILAMEAPILAIIIAIAVLVAAGVELGRHWHEIWHAIAHDFDVARHFIASVFDDIVHYAEIPINWVKAHWPLILAILTGPVGLAVYAIKGHFSQIVHGAEALVGDVTGWFKSLPGRILHAVGDMGHLLYSAGKAVVEGLIHGVEDMAGNAVSTIENIGSSMLHGAMSVLGISSPSKKFRELGQYITQGLGLGIRETMSYATGYAQALGVQVAQALNAGEITSAQAQSLTDRISADLSARAIKVAQAATKIGLAFNVSLMKSLEDPASASAAKSAVGKLASLVQQAWSSSLIGNDQNTAISNWLAGQSAKLQALAGQRAQVEKQIAAAKQFAASTASSVAGNYTISGFATSGANGGVATVGQIVSGLRLDVSHIRKFAANLKKLAKEGLNKNYLNQLIQMGPEQGGDLAAELAAAGIGDIKAINSAESAISKSSGQLGKQAANEMYDTGKNAGEGFLSGLRGTLKSLNEMIKQMAKAMVATLKKELGISSPSTVLRWHGQMAGQGFEMGLGDSVGRVTAASQRLARAAVPQHGGYGAYGSGGGRQQMLLVLRFEKTGNAMLDEAMRALRGEVRVLGGDPDMFQRKVAFR